MIDALQELGRRVAADLETIRFPDRDWVIPRLSPEGRPAFDVAVVGAGHCGLAVAFALLRRRIGNITVLEAAEAGQQGPWCTYGRMPTLRSPKHFNGPDLDIPSLTCQAWYTARYGEDAWQRLSKLSTEDWQDYLLWFREVTRIPVEYRTTVHSVNPHPDGTLQLAISGPEGHSTVYARKVVFATGAEGSGDWQVPQIIRDALPADRYTQVAQPIDFASLRGTRIGVLGGGASAYDNAACALEEGAASVDLFFRRPELHRVNPHKWTEFAGFLEHFRDLPDSWRWRFMSYILPMNEPPPPETFRRATRHPGFRLHLGENWQNVDLHDGDIRITTQSGSYELDHVLVAVGLIQDVRLHRELASLQPHIARWNDRYLPPAGEENEALGVFPYLGPNLEYVERIPGAAPYLRDIHNFTAAATVSHGPSGASINGMKQAAQRLASGICRDLFTRSVDDHFKDLLAFDEPELDVPWPPAGGNGQSHERPAAAESSPMSR